MHSKTTNGEYIWHFLCNQLGINNIEKTTVFCIAMPNKV